MIVHPLKPKYIHSNITNVKPIPESWHEFASICKIRSGAKIVNFVPYDYQRELINQIDQHHTTIIVKTRQLGITETIGNYFLYKAIKSDGYLAVIFSRTQSDTSNLAKRIRRQLESISDYAVTTTDSLTDIQLKNGGRLLFRNSTPNGSRGLESVSDILYDEASFVDDIDEIYKASIPCTTVVGSAAKIIILSTPNGRSGWYFDKLNNNNGDRNLLEIVKSMQVSYIAPMQYWTDSNGWCKFLLHWLAHPKFKLQKDTYLADIKKQFDLSEETIEQEYNLSFTSSEESVFNPDLVFSLSTGVYEDAVKDEIYYMGLDTSLQGSDFTVCAIFKETVNMYSLVHLYRVRRKSSEYITTRISSLIERYKPIRVAIEVNSGGQLYYEVLQSKHLNTEFKPVNTTTGSKKLLINSLLLKMEKGIVTYPNDTNILEEFFSFNNVDGKLKAKNGKHDDIIMAISFALYGI